MNALMIANTQIRRDVVGRYCLNDLHQASGGEAKNQPPRWLRLVQTQDLIQELLKSGDRYPEMGSEVGQPAAAPVVAIEGGLGQGTYAVKELVYAYAMWISARFHLHVIRAYDAMVTGSGCDNQPSVPTSPQHRADVLVAASRGFSTLVRVGRNIGMDRVRSIRAANTATLRATGIDLVSELEAADVLEAQVAPAPLVSLTDQLQNVLAPWLHGREQVTTEEVILGALNGNPGNKELQTRVGIALRRLHWRQRRPTQQGKRTRVWYAPKGRADSDG
jgi:hypothetical protein